MASTIEAKRAEHMARVRALAAVIRVERLDESEATVDVPPEEVARRETLAEAIYAEHGRGEVEEATRFADYLAQLAPKSCSTCHGIGALKQAAAPSAAIDSVSHAEAQVVAEQYVLCGCVLEEQRRRDRAKQDARPPFVVSTTKPADAEKRIADARAVLERARREQAEACAALDERIAAARAPLDASEADRTVLVAMESDAERILSEITNDAQACVAAAQREVDEARARLEASEGRLATARRALFERTSEAANGVLRASQAVVEFDAARAGQVEAHRELVAQRAKVAERRQPKIDRAAKLLRRLIWLYGDPLEGVKEALESGQKEALAEAMERAARAGDAVYEEARRLVVGRGLSLVESLSGSEASS